MSRYVVTLPYPPSGNRYWRHVGRNVVVSAEAKAYRVKAGFLARAAGMHPVRCGDVSVMVQVFRPRKAGDLDNTLKVLLDSLRGVAYADDSQVAAIHAVRFEDKKAPRVVVEVEPLSGRGPL